jgi:hypothetical protein
MGLKLCFSSEEKKENICILEHGSNSGMEMIT